MAQIVACLASKEDDIMCSRVQLGTLAVSVETRMRVCTMREWMAASIARADAYRWSWSAHARTGRHTGVRWWGGCGEQGAAGPGRGEQPAVLEPLLHGEVFLGDALLLRVPVHKNHRRHQNEFWHLR